MLAADLMSLVADAKAQETPTADAGHLLDTSKNQDVEKALDTMLVEGETTVEKASAAKRAHVVVAQQTPQFPDIWSWLSALDLYLAQMKFIAIEGDSLELALSYKNALEVSQKLQKNKMPDLEIIVAELKPYFSLLSQDLQASLSSLLSESCPQEDVVPALLAELRADLEEAKAREINSDNLQVALSIKHAVTMIAELFQNAPSAADVLFALQAHKEVVDEEWRARIFSLVPSSSGECGSPAKRSRT